MRNIFSEKNKSIYQMTKKENEEDRMTAIKWLGYGMAWGIGGFCTLWVAIALIISVYFPPIPDVPVTVTVEDLILESYELEKEQKIDSPPITIPSVPDDEKWIIVKRRAVE